MITVGDFSVVTANFFSIPNRANLTGQNDGHLRTSSLVPFCGNTKEEVNEADQFGRKRTSHARSEVAAKKLGRYVNPQHKQTRNRTCQSNKSNAPTGA
jgi:hypothetical protein